MILRLLMLLLILSPLQIQSSLSFYLSSQLGGSNKHSMPIIEVKVSSDQTRLFSWDTGGNLKIWSKDNDKLTYKTTIQFNANLDIFRPTLKIADFIYITDNGQRIYLQNSDNEIQIYEYKGPGSDPLYQLVKSFSVQSGARILSITVNQQRNQMFLGGLDSIYVVSFRSDGQVQRVAAFDSFDSGGYFVNRIKLVDDQQRLLTNQYKTPPMARRLLLPPLPPLVIVFSPRMVLHRIQRGSTVELFEVTDTSIAPTQVQPAGSTLPAVNIYKFQNSLYIFSEGNYQYVNPYTLMEQGDHLQQIWTLHPGVQEIIVRGAMTYNSQVYPINYNFVNFVDKPTFKQLLDELNRLMGTNLATSFRGLQNNNFFIGKSDGGLYTSTTSDPQKPQNLQIPPNCKSYTVLSSGAVRCDICQSKYVQVVANSDDSRVCCERIQFCSQYNKSNCLCNKCFGDYLNVDKKACREINLDQKCKEYDVSKKICKRCDTGYVLDKNGICSVSKECEKGEYRNLSGICNPGNKPYCQEYESPTGDCIKCYKDYRFNGQAQCVQIPDINKDIKCPDNTPETEFYKENGKCKFRGVSCKQANEDGTCKYCMQGSFYLYKGVCIPLFYPVDPNEVNIRRDNV